MLFFSQKTEMESDGKKVAKERLKEKNNCTFHRYSREDKCQPFRGVILYIRPYIIKSVHTSGSHLLLHCCSTYCMMNTEKHLKWLQLFWKYCDFTPLHVMSALFGVLETPDILPQLKKTYLIFQAFLSHFKKNKLYTKLSI